MTRIFAAILTVAALAGCGSDIPECPTGEYLCNASGFSLCQDGQWNQTLACGANEKCQLTAAVERRVGVIYVDPICVAQ